jgi:hypothetical protein
VSSRASPGVEPSTLSEATREATWESTGSRSYRGS